jgi:XapX domain-containing protein
MREILLSLCTGAIVGVIFSFAKLPIPAPQALAGIAGIFGIYLGYVGVTYLLGFFG